MHSSKMSPPLFPLFQKTHDPPVLVYFSAVQGSFEHAWSESPLLLHEKGADDCTTIRIWSNLYQLILGIECASYEVYIWTVTIDFTRQLISRYRYDASVVREACQLSQARPVLFSTRSIARCSFAVVDVSWAVESRDCNLIYDVQVYPISSLLRVALKALQSGCIRLSVWHEAS